MQKLFESWRGFKNEAQDPDSDADDAAELRNMAPEINREFIEKIIGDFSFNSAQSSQHRWSPRQPIIDYYFDKRIGNWKFQAAIPDGTNDADKWPRVPEDGTWSDQDVVEFLTRVKDNPNQLNLFENFRSFTTEGVMDDKPYLTDKAAAKRLSGADNIYTEKKTEEPQNDEIKKKIKITLKREGGASGLDPLLKAARKIDPKISKKEVKQIISVMSDVEQHTDKDYIDVSGLKEAVALFLEMKEDTLDEKKKKKRDACYHKVKARYKVWPSAYASGALVKCRKKGAKNWGTGGKKKKKKNESLSLEDMIRGEIQNVLNEKGPRCWTGYKKNPNKPTGPGSCIQAEDSPKEEMEEDLKKWFSQNKGKGWVDCKTGKPCGRQKGEKRKGYPACRPTMAQCTEKGKRAKKSSAEVDWK